MHYTEKKKSSIIRTCIILFLFFLLLHIQPSNLSFPGLVYMESPHDNLDKPHWWYFVTSSLAKPFFNLRYAQFSRAREETDFYFKLCKPLYLLWLHSHLYLHRFYFISGHPLSAYANIREGKVTVGCKSKKYLFFLHVSKMNWWRNRLGIIYCSPVQTNKPSC